jgi:hypothetical protein
VPVVFCVGLLGKCQEKRSLLGPREKLDNYFGNKKNRDLDILSEGECNLSPANNCLVPIGMDMHHSGVEILETECSFGLGQGIFEGRA